MPLLVTLALVAVSLRIGVVDSPGEQLDLSGLPRSVLRAEGMAQVAEFNAWGELTRLAEQRADGSEPAVTEHAYDAGGARMATRAPDGLGGVWLTSVHSAADPTIPSTFTYVPGVGDGEILRAEHNSRGQITAEEWYSVGGGTDPTTTRAWEFDALGRPVAFVADHEHPRDRDLVERVIPIVRMRVG